VDSSTTPTAVHHHRGDIPFAAIPVVLKAYCLQGRQTIAGRKVSSFQDPVLRGRAALTTSGRAVEALELGMLSPPVGQAA
jgi:hypothetical protein